MADSKSATDTNLDNFLEDIVTERLNFSQSDQEVHVLQQLVRDLVNNIVKEAFPPDSGFTVREIIPVGSMAEDTRIIGPNEFDFMIVLDKFHANDIDLTFMESGAEGVFVDVESECRRENCVFALDESIIPILYDRDAQRRECVCNLSMLHKKKIIINLLDKAQRKLAADDWSCPVSTFPGKLRVEKNFSMTNGPALQICLKWETNSDKEKLETILVDLVSVIELEINEVFLNNLHVFHQQYYNKLKAIKKVHAMNHCGFSCREVSFAFIEVQLLRDENETHKKCYKLLKYAYRNIRLITSFVLKNLVLQHAVCCEGGGLGRCFLKILGDLRDKLSDSGSERPIIPHIFCTQRNTVKVCYTVLEFHEKYKDYWIDHRNNLRLYIGNLKKIKDGMPTPSSFQFCIPDDEPYIDDAL